MMGCRACFIMQTANTFISMHQEKHVLNYMMLSQCVDPSYAVTLFELCSYEWQIYCLCLFCDCKNRNGIQQRRNSFEDGVIGTTCPIPPGKNFTYILQVKDQIGSFYYFPSLGFHKAAGGFGGIRILSRPRIPVPFDDPAGDYTILIGDWYLSNHTVSINPSNTLFFTS